jgi:hypothetical protein
MAFIPNLYCLCDLYTEEYGGTIIQAMEIFLDGCASGDLLKHQCAVDTALGDLSTNEMFVFLTDDPSDEWAKELHRKVFTNEILQTVYENFTESGRSFSHSISQRGRLRS